MCTCFGRCIFYAKICLEHRRVFGDHTEFEKSHGHIFNRCPEVLEQFGCLIITKCPACNERLYISSLKCQKCGLELKNDFEISKYDLLDKEQLNFLETFLACEGNLKELQNRMNISYPLAKKKLFELLAALQIKERNNTEVVNMENTLICNNGHTAADIIRNRIIENGGCATYYTYDGTEHQVYAIKNGTEFATDALPVNITYSFEIFNCVSDAIKANGGKARKEWHGEIGLVM